jgi:hypothetical protein
MVKSDHSDDKSTDEKNFQNNILNEVSTKHSRDESPSTDIKSKKSCVKEVLISEKKSDTSPSKSNGINNDASNKNDDVNKIDSINNNLQNKNKDSKDLLNCDEISINSNSTIDTIDKESTISKNDKSDSEKNKHNAEKNNHDNKEDKMVN